MSTTPEYDAILARKMKERETQEPKITVTLAAGQKIVRTITPEGEIIGQHIVGNVSSEKMTEEQTQAEIARVTEGVFIQSTTDTGPAIPNDSGTVAKEGLPEGIIIRKRGRPKGSKNKPKDAKA